jgi:hypothetical protein
MMGRNFRIVYTILLSFVLFIGVSWGAIVFFPTPALAIYYAKETLIGSDFSGRDLQGVNFNQANLRDSNFSNANLQGISFFGANLQKANLTGANLQNSTLDTARMMRANLTNALLQGSFAFNTKFDGAIIDGADFTDVFMRDDTKEILCKLAKGTNPITGNNTRDTLLCDE